jgi:hypothetical protein
MINTFTVKANSDKNELSIKMDGYFMKSELELALYLVKKETKKLISGFTVLMDIKNLNSSNTRSHSNKRWVSNLAKSIGAGKIKQIGLISY